MTDEQPRKDVTEAVFAALDETDTWEQRRDHVEAERQAAKLESALQRVAEKGQSGPRSEPQQR
jgi:hypothetical protein